MTQAPPLPRYALFSGMLAMAGLPIYIHAPKHFADTYGIGLGALGLALLLVRAVDFLQDPAFGWLGDRLGRWRGVTVGAAVALMVAGFAATFAIPAPIQPLIWFILCMLVVFSAYSLLSILFYARGVTRAAELGAGGHLHLAAWRESGTLIGICLAAALPSLLVLTGLQPAMIWFSTLFAVVALFAAMAMRAEWQAAPAPRASAPKGLLSDSVVQRLLLMALFNAAPLAVSATLFLFFVDARLGLPDFSGPLLLLFFLSAAASVPIWSWVAARLGTRNTLSLAMLLAIVSFSGVVLLGHGDGAAFAIICLASGAALGADLTLLPALFAGRIAALGAQKALAFGYWNFCTKLTLALAAATVLPLLERAGFTSAGPNSDAALWALTIAYAVVPVVLKTCALILLRLTPIEET